MEKNHQNGWGFTQNIFHMEWVESLWNDMDSTWIPCGIHVECGGTVKTSTSSGPFLVFLDSLERYRLQLLGRT